MTATDPARFNQALTTAVVALAVEVVTRHDRLVLGAEGRIHRISLRRREVVPAVLGRPSPLARPPASVNP